MADDNKTAVQLFIKAVKKFRPEQRIEVRPVSKKKDDEGNLYWLPGKEYNDAEDFDRDVEEKKPIMVRIDAEDFIGSPEKILETLKAAAAPSRVRDLTA